MKNPLFSIIIPVYNVEKYLDECINSIVSQLFHNYEVVLVDDGSTDGSGNKCDWWSEQYQFISVIHKENGGLSSARNAGLEQAKGEYILFIDSDDKIVINSLSKIAEAVLETRSDIYFLTAIKFYHNGYRERLDEPLCRENIRNRNKKEVIKYLSELSKFPGASWSKAYRRDFLEKNNIRFPADRRISEDLGFVLACFFLADSFDVIETDYYEYRQNREGSITSKATNVNKAFRDLSLFLTESIDLLAEKNVPKDEMCKYALSFVAYEYAIALLKYLYVSNRTNAKKLLNDYKWVCQYSRSKRGIIINKMIKILGIELTAVILTSAYNIRENVKYHRNIQY